MTLQTSKVMGIQKHKSKWLKFLLSIFLVYHLLSIVVLPNGSSFLGRSIQSWILPYANTLGFNTTWNFYSPDPAHTMYFGYSVFFEDEQGNDLRPSLSGYFPPEQNQIVTDPSKRRLLYAMRFLMLDPTRLDSVLGPWLCRSHNGATRVSLQHVVEVIPPLEKALVMNKVSFESTHSQRMSHNCVNKKDVL